MAYLLASQLTNKPTNLPYVNRLVTPTSDLKKGRGGVLICAVIVVISSSKGWGRWLVGWLVA